MADPNSFRSMRVVNKSNGAEAEIAVSDFDSRKHKVLAAPHGAGPSWAPPADRAPFEEREAVEWAEPPPSAPTVRGR